MEKILDKILTQINKGEEISPFLFIDKNSEILNEKIKNLALEILKKYEIPKVFFYTLQNSWENIKIEEIKKFLENANKTSPYKIQIFFIENIGNLTLQWANSLLKFLEEPGIQNLIFLSSSTESGILDTILSRVQIVYFASKKTDKIDNFIQNLLSNFVYKNDQEIISYFYKEKLEKADYINFLQNLVLFIKKNLIFINYLDEILEDLNAIEQNNVNAKFIVDKWILKLRN